ncbi:unnamed protein product [Caenorhabditis auriculariae]|uniref:CWH43-like N-terminal domain-containing protein n=1 Tax=Caenorhabditis auriculariae TaxID=2777116 RepID=A0A8S1HXN2_9PELO|nr:unnamed protein product [Caenorhabditis auriculariae]
MTSPMNPPIEDTVERMLRIRWVVILGALLPGIGCYFVVGYTYLFQFERVYNFTEQEQCPDLHIFLPPVSYSIGVWEPQRYIWLLVMFAHLPPRLFFTMLYRRLFINSAPKSVLYRWSTCFFLNTMWLEPFGLILVSVVDIKGAFMIHALGYVIWIVSFNFNMLFNILLHHFAGIRDTHCTMETTWRIKLVIFLIGLVCALSTAVSFPVFSIYCSGMAYNLFSLAELIEVGCNSLFYAVSYYEFPKTRVTLGIRSFPRNCSSLDKVVLQAPPLPEKQIV